MRCLICRTLCVKCKGGRCKCGMNEQQVTITNAWYNEGLHQGIVERTLALLAMSGETYESGKEKLIRGVTEQEALKQRLGYMDNKVERNVGKCKYGRKIRGNVYKKCTTCGKPYNLTGGICKK